MSDTLRAQIADAEDGVVAARAASENAVQDVSSLSTTLGADACS